MPVPNPLPFLGMANDLPRFKLKLTHDLWGHQTSYPTPQRRLLYSASLLLGAAEQWLITHVDPITTLIPCKDQGKGLGGEAKTGSQQAWAGSRLGGRRGGEE